MQRYVLEKDTTLISYRRIYPLWWPNLTKGWQTEPNKMVSSVVRQDKRRVLGRAMNVERWFRFLEFGA